MTWHHVDLPNMCSSAHVPPPILNKKQKTKTQQCSPNKLINKHSIFGKASPTIFDYHLKHTKWTLVLKLSIIYFVKEAWHKRGIMLTRFMGLWCNILMLSNVTTHIKEVLILVICLVSHLHHHYRKYIKHKHVVIFQRRRFAHILWGVHK
jgi:hypothetical protein